MVHCAYYNVPSTHFRCVRSFSNRTREHFLWSNYTTETRHKRHLIKRARRGRRNNLLIMVALC